MTNKEHLLVLMDLSKKCANSRTKYLVEYKNKNDLSPKEKKIIIQESDCLNELINNINEVEKILSNLIEFQPLISLTNKK